MMKKMIMVCALVIAGSFSVYSQNISPAKRQDIHKLIEVTNAKAQMSQMVDLMFANMAGSMGSGVSADANKLIKSKFEAGINDFVNLLIPIYDKHFTHDDIKQLIRFYETPTGKKTIKVMPIITQESFDIGQKWGQNLAQEIVTELMKLQR